MKLSMETYEMRRRYDDETAIKMIKEAGFDAYDYSFYVIWGSPKDMLLEDYRERAKKLRKFSDEIGIVCNQAHAPMEFVYGEKMDETSVTYLRLIRAIEVAGILGAENIVIHTIKKNERLPDNVDLHEYNREFFSSFIPYCEKYNVCVAVENLFDWDGGVIPVMCDPKEHQSFVESINSKWITACVDVGHSAVAGYAPEYVIENMSPKVLKALHIHDNDLKEDLHTLPYLAKLDWEKITAAIKNSKYEGDLTLEILEFLRNFDDKVLPYALKLAEQTGRLLIEKIEN